MLGRMAVVSGLLLLCLVQPAASQPADSSAAMKQPPAAPAGQKDHATAVKESFSKSMATLRKYQWLETTTLSLKGEEKSKTQSNCSYGPDGKVLKVPLAPPAEAEKKRGIKGKIIENKKEEISGATKEAIALVKQYVPPDPARIQAAKTAGRVSVSTPDPAGVVRIVIKDYLKAGDSMTLDVNAATDVVSGLTVATFTEKKEPVGLKVGFGTLTDGTIHPAKILLEVPAQNLTVGIENSGYKKVGG